MRAAQTRRSVLLAFALALATSAASALPSFAEVKAAHRPSDVTLLDRQGVAIQSLRVDASVRRLGWLAIG